MKIVLFSDSHGNIHNMSKALSNQENVDMVIHLGDCVNDILRLQSIHSDLKYEMVKGNNDWARSCPTEKILDIEGKKIFLTHGHEYNVKHNYQKIVARGSASNADAVFFGHTHRTEEFFFEGMLVLNPGSIGGISANSGRPTYCVVEVTSEKIISRYFGI